MKTLETYLSYVAETLANIPPEEIVTASYNTGFGITLVNENLGDAPMTLFVAQHAVAKVRPPADDNPEWDAAWDKAKDMINTFVDARNKQ